MESNRSSNNQMALKGVLLLLALFAAGAFVLARGLDDDNSGSEATAPAVEPTADVVATADPVEAPTDAGDTSATVPPVVVDAPLPDPVTDTTAEPVVTSAPDELECRDPSTISVLVANGTDVSGAAGRLSSELNAANYVTLPPVNASPQTSSAFYYRAGYEVDAQCIGEQLGVGSGPFFLMSDPPPGGITLDTLGNAYVLILIGPDSLAQRPG
ncbi:LytR C-terminal domain-containing protein [Candidatus Poriferisocius sp.]|uniref:LytR C-terminal domain-containing protein n=1 Tax=Candidatus Poriferisocius sp. TaxID=3101276 RepID=UPI003B5CA9BA